MEKGIICLNNIIYEKINYNKICQQTFLYLLRLPF